MTPYGPWMRRFEPLREGRPCMSPNWRQIVGGCTPAASLTARVDTAIRPPSASSVAAA